MFNQNAKPTYFSLLSLLGTNALIIFLALAERWELGTIMAIYWCQSVIIGVFVFLKILDMKNFSTEGFRMNDRAVEPTKSTKIHVAFFFLMHYGIFHMVYFFFLIFENYNIAFGYVFLTSSIFFANHLISYFINRAEDSKKQKNIGTVMFFPYARIVPMHLTIIFGGAYMMQGTFQPMILLFFMGLKTLADLVMHFIEHKV
jgi:hypothetical protein